MDHRIGTEIAGYRIDSLLGRGGMSGVYLATQPFPARKVALKILRPDLAANPTALQRFKNEAEAVARVTHANIVQVYQIGEGDGMHYMALEYVEGRNLRDYVARKGPPDVLICLSIMRQVAAALQRAGTLSGGQLLRAGLACVLGGAAPPPLIILDEPTNHLDIDSIEAVEAGLRAYDGALLIVSHDEAFLANVGIGRRIKLGSAGSMAADGL